MKNNTQQLDITRTTLAVLWIGVLIVAAFWIVKPFLLAAVWASMIVVATWPILLRVQKLLWGKRGLAVAAMTVMLALVFVGPLTAALGVLFANADDIVASIKSLATVGLPQPPKWVDNLPVVGSKLSSLWREIAEAGAKGLSARVAPHAGKIASWFFSQAGNLGKTTFEFLLTVIIAGILYSTGDTAAKGVLSFARRLAGPRGEEVAVLAAKSVRAVALGVVVTAIAQATAGGIGLAVAGVPAAGILTAVMFILCIAQLGPGFVLIPSVIWLFWSGQTAWGIFLAVLTIFVGTFDNFLRPVLIKKGADLPMLLILPGVIGGLIALGIIGIFIGPVVLAVTYSLLGAWIKEGGEE
jgi:predicted PurR-regulated permease PerM